LIGLRTAEAHFWVLQVSLPGDYAAKGAAIIGTLVNPASKLEFKQSTIPIRTKRCI
jgi:hypothetical protein